MSIYKILYLDYRRNAPLSGAVESYYYGLRKFEKWGSLEDALNELAKSGWEIDTPIYGPVPGRNRQGENWLEALILVNRTSDTAREIKRQIAKIEQQIIREKVTLESSGTKSTIQRMTAERTMRGLFRIIEELKKQLTNVQK